MVTCYFGRGDSRLVYDIRYGPYGNGYEVTVSGPDHRTRVEELPTPQALIDRLLALRDDGWQRLLLPGSPRAARIRADAAAAIERLPETRFAAVAHAPSAPSATMLTRGEQLPPTRLTAGYTSR